MNIQFYPQFFDSTFGFRFDFLYTFPRVPPMSYHILVIVKSESRTLWTENCFCLVVELTIKNTYSQSLRSLGLKLTILQAFKVVLFYPQKWSGEWVKFNPKWPSWDVTLLTEFICAVRVSCWQVREHGQKHVQWFPNERISQISTDFRPRCLFSFLSAILRERLWHQSDIRSWYHVAFWPRDSNTIFEGKKARIWRLVESSILSLWKCVFLKANYKTKEKQFSARRHFKMYVFDWQAMKCAVHAPFCVAQQKCCPSTTPWKFLNKAMCKTLIVNMAMNDQVIVKLPASFRSAVWKYYGFRAKDGTIEI